MFQALLFTLSPFIAIADVHLYDCTGVGAAMTRNFVLKVSIYCYHRLSDLRFLTGLASFYGVCSIGAVANVGIASAAFGHHYTWWFSGLAGAAVGSVWNYAVSSIFTWGRR